MSSHAFVAKWYTRASRVRIVIAKFDGRWRLPGGPYPIPELMALVGGILTTLLLLPRTGHPLMTAVIGVVATVIAVGVMRRMPYSPVPFGTRVHRVMRLYSSPISVTSNALRQNPSTTSMVRPVIDVHSALDALASVPDQRREPAAVAPSPTRGLAEMFGPTHSPAVELFG